MTDETLMGIGFYLEEKMGVQIYTIFRVHQLVPIDEIEAKFDEYVAQAKAFFKRYKQTATEMLDVI